MLACHCIHANSDGRAHRSPDVLRFTVRHSFGVQSLGHGNSGDRDPHHRPVFSLVPCAAEGSTSASQQIVVTNPGNSPITINTVTASGDFAVVPAFSIGAPNAVCGGVLAPGTTCLIGIVFSPTQSSGSETGTLSIRSTAGTATVNLSGSAIAGAGAVQITPAAVNFGSVKVGTATTGPSNEVVIYVNNTGNTPVAFPDPPVITGTSPTPSADFSVNPYGIYCQGNNYIPTQSNPSPVLMPPGASCSLTIVFNPSMQTQENATLTLVDSAGTQTITLTGTGTAQAQSLSASPQHWVSAFSRSARVQQATRPEKLACTTMEQAPSQSRASQLQREVATSRLKTMVRSARA